MKAVVIGGGIIGLSSAYYLQKSGWDVTVLDKTDMTDSCSYGNLGMIVPSHFIPLAAPGMLSQGIRWMFNNRSPFYVKPSLNPDLIGWGLKFMKSATPQHLERSGLPLLNLNLYSKKLYETLQHEPGFDFGYENKGILMYFKTEKFAEEEIHLGEKARSMGIDVEPLTKAQVQLLEPETELDILGAVHYKCDSHLYPNKLVPQLISHLRSAGVKMHGHSEVKSLDVVNGRVKKVITADNEFEGDVVVMAAGSWLSQLAKMASFKLPLMPGKGYSFTYRKPEKKLNVPAILCEARVAITQMNGYMRYGGTMEIGPVNNKINMNRVQGIVESVPKYFPGIQLGMPAEKDIWYGFRPCSPDGLPYLGRSSKVKNVLVAGGHAMSGISLGPASGKVMADLANDQKPEVDISIFDPQRFS
ncbi:FAD-dependent oxidoreductase [Segetibacter sp. 3557_3]|uniref:NAD(P)/FAD-dependent oxidoreductase n=1 Tax=Segetibacter sp. 3557_3 TaxID=2547429 RepID=UPI00105889F7|nr:FAD-dependent oxidoreductase [Segetibacter sp. 3557_3]TDH24156.1 FAD-dependent oxidoreductase [Segetibacter sp. 3557_3]